MRVMATRMSHVGTTLTRMNERTLSAIKMEQSPLEIRGDSKCICECQGVSLIVPITCLVELRRQRGREMVGRWGCVKPKSILSDTGTHASIFKYLSIVCS